MFVEFLASIRVSRIKGCQNIGVSEYRLICRNIYRGVGTSMGCQNIEQSPCDQHVTYYFFIRTICKSDIGPLAGLYILISESYFVYEGLHSNKRYLA